VEASDYYNPMLLKFEEYAIREPSDSGTATVSIDGGELQGMFRDCINRGCDR
jgi:hypothetical protein